MANGTVGQSFQYLTAYLKEENIRLEAEKQEEDLNKSVSMVSQKFQELGPDASPEDARRIFFDSITAAAKSGTTEAIPLIQGFYNESAQYLAGEKAARSEEAFKKELADRWGVSADPNLSAQAQGQLLGFEFQTRKDATVVGADKKNYLQSLKLQADGSYKPVGEAFQLSAVGYDEELADFKTRELFKHGLTMEQIRARGEANATAGGYQKTTYTDSKGRPVVFSKTSGYMIQVTDPATGGLTYVPYNIEEHGQLDKVESSVRKRSADQKYLQGVSSAAYKEGQNKVESITKALLTMSTLPDNIRKQLKDSKGDVEAYASTLERLSREPAKNPLYDDRLNEIINEGATDDIEAGSLIFQVERFKELDEIRRNANADIYTIEATPKEQDLNEKLNNVNLTLTDFSDSSKIVAEGISSPGTKKHQAIQTLINGYLRRPANTPVSWADYMSLDIQFKVNLTQKIQKVKK